jgi:hypothetical protein
VWRVFTSPFFHNGFLHLALNMSAWVPLSSSLERLVGTVQFTYIVLLFAALGGGLHALAGASAVHASESMPRECAVGLSGVIFSLVVVDAHLSPAITRSLFGVVSVPTRYYPLALLALLQLLLPSASLLGHLSGVLVGYAYAWGWLNVLVLSSGAVGAVERARFVAPLVQRFPTFILSAGLPDPHGGGLPRWLTAPGGADGGGMAWRTPAWLTRAWAQASAAAGMAPAGGSGGGGGGGGGSGGGGADTFNGRGRTLGGTPGARPPWASGGRPTSPPPPAGRSGSVAVEMSEPSHTPVAPPALGSAEARAEARARAARAAEARALGLLPPAGGASSAPPPAAGAIAAAAAGLLPTGAARADATPPGLRQLVEMGFREDAARSALQAAGGDISLALELLSTG